MNAAHSLVIVLANGSETDLEAAVLAFRYAETAAAMDFSVEIHVVGKAVDLFSKRHRDSNRGVHGHALSPTQRLRSANELGVKLFVCSAAMAGANLLEDDLIEEVSGVRGAASLLSAGMAPNARLLTF